MNLLFLLLLALLGLLPKEGRGESLASVPKLEAAEPAGERQKLAAWFGKLDLKAGTRLDLNGDFHGVVYARGMSLGQTGLSWDPLAKSYVDFNLGGDFQDKEKPALLVATMFHPVSVSEAIVRRLPFRDRLRLERLPDIEIGPALNLPSPGRVWTWKSAFGIVAALGF